MMTGDVRRASLVLLVVLVMFVSGVGEAMGEKVTFRLKLEAGKAYKMDLVMDQDITMDIAGVEQKMKQVIGMGMTFKVKKVTDKGDMQIGMVFHSVKMFNPAAGMDYDSTRKENPNNPVTLVFSALVGAGFDLTMTSLGEVKDIKGIDKMVDRMIANVNMPEGAKIAMKRAMKQQFNEKAFAAQLSQATQYLPKDAVEIGQRWTITRNAGGLAPMQIVDTYTLKEIKGGMAVMSLSSKIKPAAGGKGQHANPQIDKVEAKGTQSGEVKISVSTGWIVRSNLQQDLDMKMHMRHGQVIPMKVKSKVAMYPTGANKGK